MLQKRGPIITIMGHVDHGKTSLLDFIRHSNLQAREAGGITQHIGAYQIEFQGQKITFIDTPGHAAFNKMRERGAQVTDLVILVVAANDGVKPQTLESIRFIKESKVPFLVAINKVDLPDLHLEVVKGQLAEADVLLQEYGGDIEAVEISAKTGLGVDKLLETITVMADLLELQADPAAPLEAVVIESTKEKNKGPVARVIVRSGTLQTRQDLIVDEITGRIRLLENELGKSINQVLPGEPAQIIGLDEAPEVGSVIRDASVTYDADLTDEFSRTGALEKSFRLSDEVNWEKMDIDFMLGDKEKIKLIIKADVKGTLEAILQSLDKDTVEVIACGVGQVTEQDLELARDGKILLIAFNVKVSSATKKQAKNLGVKIKEYNIIYHLIEDLQQSMLKLMDATFDEVVTGEAEILQIFEMKGETIAGVRVKTGEIKKADLLHLKRGEEIIANPVLRTMKHGKEEIDHIGTKNEGGLTFKNKKLDFQVGDVIVAYKKES
jgi:translation initiation factor IF-2